MTTAACAVYVPIMIFEFLVLKYLNNIREDSTGIYDERLKWRYMNGERIGFLDRAYMIATARRIAKSKSGEGKGE